MKQLKFDVSKEDTCMKTWVFDIEENGDEQIICNLDITFTRQGCMGHPKSISALVKNRSIESIDTDLLVETTCSRGKSCGMILGQCISQIRNN
ncbi:TSCPD domain-containing protein [Marinifilum fragile]|uniref:TSCPD domain-containing protein n=1 Tax=Marinifilum fragile TaxID=570161 RepID=UPI0006D00758|nr:TSCPD domain-containing protein [Marinifilum fragile]